MTRFLSTSWEGGGEEGRGDAGYDHGHENFRPIFLIFGMVQGLHVDWFLQVAVGAIYTRCANAVNELQTYGGPEGQFCCARTSCCGARMYLLRRTNELLRRTDVPAAAHERAAAAHGCTCCGTRTSCCGARMYLLRRMNELLRCTDVPAAAHERAAAAHGCTCCGARTSCCGARMYLLRCTNELLRRTDVPGGSGAWSGNAWLRLYRSNSFIADTVDTAFSSLNSWIADSVDTAYSRSNSWIAVSTRSEDAACNKDWYTETLETAVLRWNMQLNSYE